MTAIPLGISYGVRMAAATAPWLLTNMVVETDATNGVDGKMRIQRPALDLFATVGSGPINAVLYQAGLFNGDILTVSGGQLWRVPLASPSAPVNVGNLGVSGFFQTAAGASLMLIVAPFGQVFSYNGTTLTQLAMPDGDAISSIAYLSGYFYLSVANSQKIYFIAPGNTVPGGLDYFSAESSPDNVLALATLSDELWIGKEKTFEIWQPSGDLNAPLTRISGRDFNRGILARDTLCYADNTLLWVGDDRIVYRAANVPLAISDNAISETISMGLLGTFRAWVASISGHVYYIVTFGLPTGQGQTLAYDIPNKSWSNWTSFGEAAFRGSVGTQVDETNAIAGDLASGRLYRLDPFGVTDNGDPISRELIGGVPVTGAPERCDSVEVCAAMGQSPDSAHLALLDLRWSDDQGSSWSAWRELSLGAPGQAAGKASTRALGRMYAPGRVFHLRSTSAALTRISYARLNESFG